MTPDNALTKKLVTLGALALACAANGCSELTIVGVSGEDKSVANTPPLITTALRTATEIDAVEGELLAPTDSALGDIDGDGYDDFLLSGLQVDGYDRHDGLIVTGKTATLYLFYGRGQFPEHLVSSDADATFETGVTLATFSMGDLNGDGLADFALEDRDGYEIVFGNKQRWTGHHPKFSTGTVVSYPSTVIDEDLDGTMVDCLVRLGDLNGDGKDDFAVRVVEPDAVSGNIYGLGVTEYLFEGRADNWPSGLWDPSRAVAKFGYEDDPASGKPLLHAQGDLNGDGFSDLVAYGSDSFLLYYGKPEGLRGTLSSKHRDAEIALVLQDNLFVLGDLDGDGADELATSTNNELRISYGASVPYAGSVQLQPDLTFVNQGPFWSMTLADVNGDGMQDLLLEANQTVRPIAENWDPIPAISLRQYTVFGTGTRLAGQQPPLDTVFKPVGYTLPAALTGELGFGVAGIGDIDGDGSTDLISGASSADPTDGVVYLLPGSMRAPE